MFGLALHRCTLGYSLRHGHVADTFATIRLVAMQSPFVSQVSCAELARTINARVMMIVHPSTHCLVWEKSDDSQS